MDEAEDPDVFDWFEADRDAGAAYNPDTDEDQLAMERESFNAGSVSNPVTIDDNKLKAIKLAAKELAAVEADELDGVSSESPIKWLRFITTKIVSSPQRRTEFKKIAHGRYEDNPETQQLSKLMVVRDVRTRWNYTHAMIRRALLLRKAINEWVFQSETFSELVLSQKDWDLLEEVANFLEPFTHATAQMSRSSELTIPYVLPLYQALHKHLSEAADDRTIPSKFPLKIRQGARSALEKLEKYKVIADGNQYYTLGTILHPRLRSQWFGTLPDQQKAIEKAETLFRHVAETYYETARANTTTNSVSPPDLASTSDALQSQNANAGAMWLENAIEFDLPDLPASASNPREAFTDELRRYLRFEGGRPAPHASILEWWKTHHESFPTIATMARDFLAIPATSVSVERTFSKSRHICSDLRSSLKEDTITKALLSKVWIRDGLFEMNPRVQKRKKHGTEQTI